MYLESVKTEYLRYKKLAEGAIAQVDESDLSKPLGEENNSIAVIVGHVAGNLKSRFTDFLTTDGEKPWRNRDQEFVDPGVGKTELMEIWGLGWEVLLNALDEISAEDLAKKVKIRGESLQIVEALNRSMAHVSYHVGQIVFLARIFTGTNWQYLSIPKGKSGEYNLNPTMEKVPNQPSKTDSGDQT